MSLEPLKLQDLSKIQVKFFSCPFPTTSYLKALVVTFDGECGHGSSGNEDALYMNAMIKAGLAAWKPFGLILDFQHLAYEWGDMMGDVLESGQGYYVFGSIATAIIVSEKNRIGLTSLTKGTRIQERFFDSLEQALVSVERQFTEQHAQFDQKS